MICHAQRIVELQLQPRGVIQRGVDKLLQSRETAVHPQALALLGVGLSESALRQPRRHREELGSILQDQRGMLEDKGTHFLESGSAFDNIRLVQSEDNLLAPRQD